MSGLEHVVSQSPAVAFPRDGADSPSALAGDVLEADARRYLEHDRWLDEAYDEMSEEDEL